MDTSEEESRQFLLEENLRLRMQIEDLEDKLRNLMCALENESA